MFAILGPESRENRVDLYTGTAYATKTTAFRSKTVVHNNAPHVRWAIEVMGPKVRSYPVYVSGSSKGWFSPTEQASSPVPNIPFMIYMSDHPDDKKNALLREYHAALDAMPKVSYKALAKKWGERMGPAL